MSIINNMEFLKSKTCCFTGHRKIPPEQYESIAERLESEIINLINQGVVNFEAGGAIGFDMLAETTVLKLKERYPQIKLILILPCFAQTKYWEWNDIEKYYEIKRKSDEVIYISNIYTKKCMFERNRNLVDNSSCCICYKTQNQGGAAYTVKYAAKKQIKVINVAEDENK